MKQILLSKLSPDKNTALKCTHTHTHKNILLSNIPIFPVLICGITLLESIMYMVQQDE